MIHVRQTRTFEPGDPPYRGNCFAACVASVFEVPIEVLPELHGRQDSALMEWLHIHYPGVAVRTRDHVPFDADDDWPKGLYPPSGFWIANVQSPRFTEDCTAHTRDGGEPMPPNWYDIADCPHCEGTGTRPGFHAVVARFGEVAHDPHPDVTGYGWEYNGKLCGITWFEVTDPGRLIPRRVPQ